MEKINDKNIPKNDKSIPKLDIHGDIKKKLKYFTEIKKIPNIDRNG